ncbi:MAG TPA: hypothetical protein VK514_05955, partial [Candidatus Acidoferrum sp.]|nr:hypothetical protein [Candidatus Acidoferrum sp.]
MGSKNLGVAYSAMGNAAIGANFERQAKAINRVREEERSPARDAGLGSFSTGAKTILRAVVVASLQAGSWSLQKPDETFPQLSRSREKQKRRPIKRLTVVTRRMNQREFRIAQRGGRVVSGAYTFVKIVHQPW